MENRINFDMHVHFPRKPRNIEAMLALAMDRSLHFLGMVDYDDTRRYQAFSENRGLDGNPLLDETRFKVDKYDEIMTRVSSDAGVVNVVRVQEPKTQAGHVLGIGIKKDVESRKELSHTVERICVQNGLVVFPHAFSRLAEGVSINDLFDVDRKFGRVFMFGLEVNGQIPNGTARQGEWDVYNTAEALKWPLVGGSDVHGRYLREFEKVGLRRYSSIPRREGFEDNRFLEYLKYFMQDEPSKIEIRGVSNTWEENVAWKLDSIRQNGLPMLVETLGRVLPK